MMESPLKIEMASKKSTELLSRAIESGRIDEVDTLLLAGASTSHNFPLHLAIDGGRSDIVNSLLCAEASPDQHDGGLFRLGAFNYPIHLAAQRGECAMVEALLAAGASVSARNGDGFKALHLAVSGENKNHEHIVQDLIEAGSNVEAKDRLGRTALHLAVNPAIVRLLIMAGADTEANFNRLTPLQLAVENRKHAIVQALVDGGASVEVLNDLQQTPLTISSMLGDDVLVSTLLGADATTLCVDSHGMGPLDYSAFGRHGKVMSLLTSARYKEEVKPARWDAKIQLHHERWAQLLTMMKFKKEETCARKVVRLTAMQVIIVKSCRSGINDEMRGLYENAICGLSDVDRADFHAVLKVKLSAVRIVGDKSNNLRSELDENQSLSSLMQSRPERDYQNMQLVESSTHWSQSIEQQKHRHLCRKCADCRREFNAMTWRHQCNACGAVCCSSCIAKRKLWMQSEVSRRCCCTLCEKSLVWQQHKATFRLRQASAWNSKEYGRAQPRWREAS